MGINGTTDTGWATFRWRFKERWSLNLVFNRFERDGEAIVGDTYNFNGSQFPVDAAYQYTDLDFEYDPDNKKVEYEISFDGLSVFASYSL